MMALLGAHRVGKTTLAEEFAKQKGWKFARTSVAAIFKDLGYDPKGPFDFATRIKIQNEIMTRQERFFWAEGGEHVVTDRCPLDFLAYTMCDIMGETVSPEQQEWFRTYTQRCFDVTNRHFSTLLLVQPGIELVTDPEKPAAAVNEAFIEHMNTVFIGLTNDPRLKVPHFYIPRERMDLDQRIKSVEFAHKRTVEKAELELCALDPEMLH
jgi:hypothetical protein